MDVPTGLQLLTQHIGMQILSEPGSVSLAGGATGAHPLLLDHLRQGGSTGAVS